MREVLGAFHYGLRQRQPHVSNLRSTTHFMSGTAESFEYEDRKSVFSANCTGTPPHARFLYHPYERSCKRCGSMREAPGERLPALWKCRRCVSNSVVADRMHGQDCKQHTDIQDARDVGLSIQFWQKEEISRDPQIQTDFVLFKFLVVSFQSPITLSARTLTIGCIVAIKCREDPMH